MNEPALLRIPEAARYLGIGQTKVFELLKLGKLRRTKIGRATRIRRRELEKFIDVNTRRAKVEPPGKMELVG